MKNYNPEVSKEYLDFKKSVLEDMRVWARMSDEEQAQFSAITREFELERFTRSMFDKYIMNWR